MSTSLLQRVWGIFMRKICETILCRLCSSAILAGLIVFVIGLYYMVVKAGIPYQDPPLELQIKYAIHSGIGDILVRDGFLILLYAGIFRLVLWLVFRYCFKKEQPKTGAGR